MCEAAAGRCILPSALLTICLPSRVTLRPNRIAWLASNAHSLLAVLDFDIELYLTLDPLTDEALAMQIADSLRRYLRDKKVQACFSLDLPRSL
jgi:hypothetical protein